MRRLEPAAIGGVMSREVANFRTFWKSTAFSSLMEPTVYLLAFGLGLGATVVTQVDGLDYVEFVGTGMVATAVIFSSALPAMFGTFVKHRFQNTYDAILAAPVDVEELVTAEMLWIGAARRLLRLLPAARDDAVRPRPGLGDAARARSSAFVTALGFAGFGIAVAASVAKIDQFNYVTTLVITPMFLVAGTFFPIDQLPEWAQVAAQFNPLYQLVELVRGACFGFEAIDLLRLGWPDRVRARHVAGRGRAADEAADRLGAGMLPQSFDRMRALVLVSSGTNLPVAAATLLLVALVDVPGDWESFLLGMATLAVVFVLVMPYLWWSLRRMKGQAPLPEDASIRTPTEILAGSVRGLLLWAGVAIGFTLLFGTYMAGLAAGAALLTPFGMIPIWLAERRHSMRDLHRRRAVGRSVAGRNALLDQAGRALTKRARSVVVALLGQWGVYVRHVVRIHPTGASEFAIAN